MHITSHKSWDLFSAWVHWIFCYFLVCLFQLLDQARHVLIRWQAMNRSGIPRFRSLDSQRKEQSHKKVEICLLSLSWKNQWPEVPTTFTNTKSCKRKMTKKRKIDINIDKHFPLTKKNFLLLQTVRVLFYGIDGNKQNQIPFFGSLTCRQHKAAAGEEKRTNDMITTSLTKKFLWIIYDAGLQSVIRCGFVYF